MPKLDGDNYGARDKYESKPFEGNRQDFLDFTEAIKTAVMNKCDERVFKYLFPNTPWIYDGVTNMFIKQT